MDSIINFKSICQTVHIRTTRYCAFENKYSFYLQYDVSPIYMLYISFLCFFTIKTMKWRYVITWPFISLQLFLTSLSHGKSSVTTTKTLHSSLIPKGSFFSCKATIILLSSTIFLLFYNRGQTNTLDELISKKGFWYGVNWWGRDG